MIVTSRKRRHGQAPPGMLKISILI